MKWNGRDGITGAAIVAVLVFLALGAEKGKGKQVPLDERHKPLLEAMKSGRSQAATELVCATCHGQRGLALPKTHPPKEQCLICHPLPSRT